MKQIVFSPDQHGWKKLAGRSQAKAVWSPAIESYPPEEACKIKSQSNGTDNSGLAIPAFVGQGSIATTYCFSGVRLIISDFKLHQPSIIKIENPQACYGFGFCLSGSIEARPSCCKKAFIVKGGQSGFFNFPEIEAIHEIINTERVLRIGIYMAPDFLPILAGREPEQLPPVLTNDLHAPSRNADEITPLMQAALHQILKCPYQGLTRHLYIEAKVLELIAHKIAQLDARAKGTVHKRKLTADEIERVHQAASLLSFDLEHPPNITELSSDVGMCRSKLFACFQEVYGITPFGYLYQKRMEKAGRLLKAGEINVAQAAYAVGYSSPSHFAKAFKKYFGFPPSQYLKTAFGS